MIRDANDSDLSSLAAAMVRLQEAHVIAFPDIYRRLETEDALTHLSGLLSRPNATVRVALHSGAVVGHAVFLIETRPESMFTHSQRYGQIAQIEVEPAFRRRGFGRLLLADCEQIAASHDLHRIALDVWAFNDSAKAFYKALGYNDFGSKLSQSV
jgi:ribosomal protein S18 acetylase RimI-like enzyme